MENRPDQASPRSRPPKKAPGGAAGGFKGPNRIGDEAFLPQAGTGTPAFYSLLGG